MSDDNQHPPMNGDEELAKTLEGGLQFEETPAPGDGDQAAPTMSSSPNGTMGDPLANMPTPTLPGDNPGEDKPLMPPLDPSALDDNKPEDKPAEETSTENAELPAVHHAHENQSHMNHQDDRPAEPPKQEEKPEEPKAEMPAPYIPALHEEKHEEHHKPSGSLEKIKESALEDLKPLVGKLKLEPDEKFDTLLLIIRSTDDQSLLDEAHAAAKDISDETKRAQALLDIIKEVDYFSNKK